MMFRQMNLLSCGAFLAFSLIGCVDQAPPGASGTTSSSSAGGSQEACTPGDTEACTCGDRKGAKACSDDGSGYGVCSCHSGSGNSTSSGSGGSSNTSTTSVTTGSGGHASTSSSSSVGGASSSSSSTSASSGSGGAMACIPGMSLGCACSGGGNGAKVCNGDGTAYGACECTNGTGGASSSSTTSSSTGSGTSMVCVPNQTVGCVCSNGHSGSQSCNQSGTGYNACVCTESTSSTGTGTGGNTGPTGTLAVTVVSKRTGSHAYNVFDMSNWTGSPNWSQSGVTRFTFSTQVTKGSTFVFNGVFDPSTSDPSQGAYWDNQFCDPNTLAQKASVWATFDDGLGGGAKYTAPVVIVSNNQGGCNLQFVAQVSALINTGNPSAPDYDADGDGYSPNDPDPLKRDCDDGNGSIHPGQVETPDDNVDMDCDGNINPPRAVVRMSVSASGYTPMLLDISHWQVQQNQPTPYAMNWNASGYFQSDPIDMDVAPSKFYFAWGTNPVNYDSSYYGGVCHDLTNGVEMFRDTDGTLIPVTLQVDGSSCHRFDTPQ